MNYTVIPKSIMNFQTGNSKPVDVYVWAVIKCCSNHKTNISHVTEEKLSLLTGLDERSIRRSIKRLKDAGYLTVQTYPAKIAGFLLLLKSVCLNNTDTIQWSNSQIAKAIGLSRNTTTALIKECQQLGLIKAIEKGYELTAGCFINSAVRKTDAGIYKELCDFCKKKGVAAPKWDKRAMSVLLTKYNIVNLPSTEPISLTCQLDKRCKNLPEKVSLAYFIKALDMQGQYREVMERAERAKTLQRGVQRFCIRITACK